MKKIYIAEGEGTERRRNSNNIIESFKGIFKNGSIDMSQKMQYSTEFTFEDIRIYNEKSSMIDDDAYADAMDNLTCGEFISGWVLDMFMYYNSTGIFGDFNMEDFQFKVTYKGTLNNELKFAGENGEMEISVEENRGLFKGEFKPTGFIHGSYVGVFSIVDTPIFEQNVMYCNYYGDIVSGLKHGSGDEHIYRTKNMKDSNLYGHLERSNYEDGKPIDGKLNFKTKLNGEDIDITFEGTYDGYNVKSGKFSFFRDRNNQSLEIITEDKLDWEASLEGTIVDDRLQGWFIRTQEKISYVEKYEYGYCINSEKYSGGVAQLKIMIKTKGPLATMGNIIKNGVLMSHGKVIPAGVQLGLMYTHEQNTKICNNILFIRNYLKASMDKCEKTVVYDTGRAQRLAALFSDENYDPTKYEDELRPGEINIDEYKEILETAIEKIETKKIQTNIDKVIDKLFDTWKYKDCVKNAKTEFENFNKSYQEWKPTEDLDAENTNAKDSCREHARKTIVPIDAWFEQFYKDVSKEVKN